MSIKFNSINDFLLQKMYYFAAQIFAVKTFFPLNLGEYIMFFLANKYPCKYIHITYNKSG